MGSRRRIVAAIALAGMIAVAVALADGARRCVPPPDAVFVARAIDTFLRLSNPSRYSGFDTLGMSETYELVPYASADDLLRANPACCRITGLSDRDGRMVRDSVAWRHDLHTFVTVTAPVRYIGAEGPVAEIVALVPLTSCAVPIRRNEVLP